jgi:hypothetical protein
MCAAEFYKTATGEEFVVLVGHHPITVMTTTPKHLDRLTKKPDGHYNREDLLPLVKDGKAALYDEQAVRSIARAIGGLIFGCPPRW